MKFPRFAEDEELSIKLSEKLSAELPKEFSIKNPKTLEVVDAINNWKTEVLSILEKGYDNSQINNREVDYEVKMSYDKVYIGDYFAIKVAAIPKLDFVLVDLVEVKEHNN